MPPSAIERAAQWLERTAPKGAPRALARAPGRVNLIGDHTDYQAGLVLPAAIDRDAAVATFADPALPGGTVAAHALDFDQSADLAPGARPSPGHWSSYVAGVAEGLRERGVRVSGVRLAVASDVSVGSGLSSSAALCVALATALAALEGQSLDPTETATLAQRAERDFAGVPCGIMDQFVSSHARAGHALLLDCRSLRARHVPLPRGVAVLALDTRTPRALADGRYAQRRAACEAAATHLRLVTLRDATANDLSALPSELAPFARHVVTENARVAAMAEALASDDPVSAGRLMTLSHRSLRDDFAVSCPELDTAADALLAAGAFGARLTGGGFGGCAVALVPAAAAAAVASAAQGAFARRFGRVPPVLAPILAAGAEVVAVSTGG
jgi:galactokinase